MAPPPFNADLLRVCCVDRVSQLATTILRAPRVLTLSLARLPAEGVSDAPDLELNQRLYQQSAAEKGCLPSRDRAENQGRFLLVVLRCSFPGPATVPGGSPPSPCGQTTRSGHVEMGQITG